MKRSMLYAVLGLLVFGLLNVVLAAPDKPVTLLVDGKPMPTTPPPVLRDGRVYLPVTAFRPIGLAVMVGSSREVSVAWPESGDIIDFKAGVDRYTRDAPKPGEAKLSGIPFMTRGVLMVPVKDLLSEHLTAKWDADTHTLSLRRSESWLRWRLGLDVTHIPDVYSDVFLGDYVPILADEEIARAEKLDASGDWQGAVKVLRSVIELRPFTWDTSNWDTGRPNHEWHAYEPLGRILTREQPRKAEGYLYLGIGLALDEKYREAEEAFRRAADINPSSPDAHFAAGWVLLRAEPVPTGFRTPDTLRKALGDLDRALDADPEHERSLRSSGHAWLGLAYSVNMEGGYTPESRVETRPYLINALDRFERLQEVAPSPGISHFIETIQGYLD